MRPVAQVFAGSKTGFMAFWLVDFDTLSDSFRPEAVILCLGKLGRFPPKRGAALIMFRFGSRQ